MREDVEVLSVVPVANKIKFAFVAYEEIYGESSRLQKSDYQETATRVGNGGGAILSQFSGTFYPY